MIRKIILITFVIFVIFIGDDVFANLPLPSGQSTWIYSGAVLPVNSDVPSDARPIGVGPVGVAGNTATVAIGTNQFEEPVDMYLALYYPAISTDIYLLTSSQQLQALTDPMQKWKQGLNAPVSQVLFSNVQIGPLPAGECYIGLLVTPAGDSSKYYLWITSFARAKIAFVTSETGSGNLGTWTDAGGKTGVDAGDAICAARAKAAGLYGDFKAWLSDDNDDAYCRIHNLTGKKSANCGQGSLPVAAGPWIRTDGFPFGDSIDEIVNNDKVYAPLRYDEFGHLLTSGMVYLTGTDGNGTVEPGNKTCSNWTSSASSEMVGIGSVDATAHFWTSYGISQCNGFLNPLACLQTGSGPSLPPFSSPGKKAFITSSGANGNLSGWTGAGGKTGLAAADSVCQSMASSAGLPNAGQFTAWMSDSSTNAKDRISGNGPWVRLDGVKVAENKAALLGGRLFSPINLTETGTYIGNHGVWTGTASDGTKTSDNCSNWTSGMNSTDGMIGRPNTAGSTWSEGYPTSCDYDYPYTHLYCLED